MRKLTLAGLAFVFAAFCAAPLFGATWYRVGSSAFTTTPSLNQDYKRIRLNCIAIDGLGNVYATAVNANNEGTNAGGYTIFKTDGSKIDVNLNALGYPGGITKMVRAGDGMIYALQNWMEINWNFPPLSGGSYIPSRILRLDPNGGVTVIKEYSPVTTDGSGNWTNKIAGMTVGGDGNVYWIMNGNDGYWKYHFLWRYDVASGSIEEAPINVSNNGWLEVTRLLAFEYTGNGWFHVIKMGSSAWRADPISWTQNRVVGVESNPGWGRDWCTGTAFDPVKNKLWIGARGSSNRLILSRWNGNGSGQFQSHDMWHSPVDADLGTIWWISAIACHPITGDAWMAYGINSPLNNIAGYRGKVIRYDEYLNLYDEGTPEAGADVVAIAFNGDVAYATTLNNTTGVYTLYTTAADSIPPTVTITSPTSNPTYLTNSPTINIAGTASDNVGVTLVSWTNDRGGSGNCTGTTNWSATGITLYPGTNVITVTARDAAGNTGTDTLTVTYDNVPPSVTINQAANQLDPTHGATINFTVVFSEAVTGFTTGDVVISGTAGATSAVVSGAGTTYTVSVSGMTNTGTVIATIPAGVAQDAAGNGNTASTSTDNQVTWIAGGTRISDAKALPNNTSVGLVIKTVSAVFSDHFYVQDTNGMGIKVKPTSMPGTIAVGKKVDIAGVMKTDANDERYIDGIASVQTGIGSTKPVGMCNRSLGGGDWLYVPSTGAGQKGVTDANGLNNIGLLVTTTGNIVETGPNYFVIDDGSGVPTKCIVPAGVSFPTSGYVSVTGISSMEKVSGKNNRVVKIRMQADIR